MKNKIGLICILLLMGFCSFGQNGSNKMKTKALEALNKINLKDYQNDATELYDNYKKLEKNNDSLEKVLEAKENKIIKLEMQLKYFQLREQIETGKLSNEIVKDFSETGICDLIGNQINILLFENGPCPECKTLFAIDNPNFIQVYPITYNAIKNGTIKLNELQYQVKVKSNIIPVSYPPLLDIPKNTNEQKRLANLYLQSIKDINNSRAFDFDVMSFYMEMEKIKVPKKEVGELITLRKKYIIYLKNYKP